MTFTIITQGNFHLLRLVQGGDSYWLQQFSDRELHQMEFSEAEIRTILEALPPRLLCEALMDIRLPLHKANEDNNPFFHLGEG